MLIMGPGDNSSQCLLNGRPRQEVPDFLQYLDVSGVQEFNPGTSRFLKAGVRFLLRGVKISRGGMLGTHPRSFKSSGGRLTGFGFPGLFPGASPSTKCRSERPRSHPWGVKSSGGGFAWASFQGRRSLQKVGSPGFFIPEASSLLEAGRPGFIPGTPSLQ
jgi:hypothetical protein